MRINLKQIHKDVKEFNLALSKKQEPTNVLELRNFLIQEEIKEFEEEIFKDEKDIQKIVKECCDVIYVAMGGVIEMFPDNMATVATDVNILTANKAIVKVHDSAKQFNSNLDRTFLFPILNGIMNYTMTVISYEQFKKAWAEVHRSNMSKTENISFDENGKVQKGDYSVADLSFLKPKTKRKVKKLIESDKTEKDATATN
jgi:ParB-like chromosome segregation protein Spo0J